MEKGQIKWFKRERKAEVIRQVDSENVEIRFMEGLGDIKATVKAYKLFDNEGEKYRRERKMREREISKAQKKLDKLKGC